MNYIRVIPRDFFNESKLLKSMGQLSLFVYDNIDDAAQYIKIESNGEPFKIKLLEDGHLIIKNIIVSINNVIVTMKSTYNSRENYPLICAIGYDEYPVFKEDGSFEEEFLEICKNLRQNENN